MGSFCADYTDGRIYGVGWRQSLGGWRLHNTIQRRICREVGPLGGVVNSVGIDPRSTFMKVVFIVYGLAAVGAAAAFIIQLPFGWWMLLVMAVLGLWYLPFGTIVNLVTIVLLLLPALRLG